MFDTISPRIITHTTFQRDRCGLHLSRRFSRVDHRHGLDTLIIQLMSISEWIPPDIPHLSHTLLGLCVCFFCHMNKYESPSPIHPPRFFLEPSSNPQEILSSLNVPYFVAAPLLIQDLQSWKDQGADRDVWDEEVVQSSTVSFSFSRTC